MATTFGEMMMTNTRIIPVKRENKVKTVLKNSDGSMLVTQGSGEQFTIPESEQDIQAFVVWTMLNDQTTA